MEASTDNTKEWHCKWEKGDLIKHTRSDQSTFQLDHRQVKERKYKMSLRVQLLWML